MNNQTNPNVTYGYNFGVQRPQALNTQPLTAEQIDQLRKNTNVFDMRISQEDLWRAACTHKEKNGTSALIENADGSYECTICGEKFFMSEKSTEEVDFATSTIIDILQTLKTIWLDAPADLISQYMQIIPFLKKLKFLWERGIINFSKYERGMNPGMNTVSPGYGGFNAIANLMSNPYGMMGYQNNNPWGAAHNGQPPMMGQQPGFYPQQPMGNPWAPNGYDPNPLANGVPNNVQAPPVGVMPSANPGANNPVPATSTSQNEVQQQAVFNL